jgi:hypothetical protein
MAMPNEHSVTLHGSDVLPRPHHVHDSRHGANGQSLLPSLFPLRRICLAVGVLSWTVVEPCAHPHLLRERVETRARKSYLCPCLNGRAPGMILRPLGLSQVSHCRAYKLGDLTCFLPVASQSPNPGFLS